MTWLWATLSCPLDVRWLLFWLFDKQWWVLDATGVIHKPGTACPQASSSDITCGECHLGSPSLSFLDILKAGLATSCRKCASVSHLSSPRVDFMSLSLFRYFISLSFCNLSVFVMLPWNDSSGVLRKRVFIYRRLLHRDKERGSWYNHSFTSLQRTEFVLSWTLSSVCCDPIVTNSRSRSIGDGKHIDTLLGKAWSPLLYMRFTLRNPYCF